MRVLFFIYLFYSITVCFSQSTQDTVKYNKYKHVSIVKLIAAGDKYHKENVLIDGFLNIEFEGNALYLHEEDFKKGLTKNSLSLTLDKSFWKESKLKPDDVNHKYVIVTGVFINQENNLNSGLLKVTSIRILESFR